MKALFLILFIIAVVFLNTNINTNYNTHEHKIEKLDIVYEHTHAEVNTSFFYEQVFQKEDHLFKNQLIQNVIEIPKTIFINSIFKPPIF